MGRACRGAGPLSVPPAATYSLHCGSLAALRVSSGKQSASARSHGFDGRSPRPALELFGNRGPMLCASRAQRPRVAVWQARGNGRLRQNSGHWSDDTAPRGSGRLGFEWPATGAELPRMAATPCRSELRWRQQRRVATQRDEAPGPKGRDPFLRFPRPRAGPRQAPGHAKGWACVV